MRVLVPIVLAILLSGCPRPMVVWHVENASGGSLIIEHGSSRYVIGPGKTKKIRALDRGNFTVVSDTGQRHSYRKAMESIATNWMQLQDTYFCERFGRPCFRASINDSLQALLLSCDASKAPIVFDPDG